jgi:hypothetical protein
LNAIGAVHFGKAHRLPDLANRILISVMLGPLAAITSLLCTSRKTQLYQKRPQNSRHGAILSVLEDVWVGVSKEQIYEYSPSLLVTKGVDWTVGEDEVCRQLNLAINAE